MKKDLLKIRTDLMYAMEQNSKTLLGFAINDLDTFLYKNDEALTIHLVDSRRELLIGLLTKLENGGGSKFIDKEEIVDDYLQGK